MKVQELDPPYTVPTANKCSKGRRMLQPLRPPRPNNKTDDEHRPKLYIGSTKHFDWNEKFLRRAYIAVPLDHRPLQQRDEHEATMTTRHAYLSDVDLHFASAPLRRSRASGHGTGLAGVSCARELAGGLCCLRRVPRRLANGGALLLHAGVVGGSRTDRVRQGGREPALRPRLLVVGVRR